MVEMKQSYEQVDTSESAAAMSVSQSTKEASEDRLADQLDMEGEITVEVVSDHDEDDDDEGNDFEDQTKAAKEGQEKERLDKNDGKKKRRSKKKSQVGVRYPSQYMRIGQIHCIFLSCFYRGRSPVLTLGPSWPFTLFLLCLATLILGYFYMMIQIGAGKANFYHLLWCYFCIFLNLFMLFGGILKNPGIPQRHIDRILKEQQGKGEEGEDDIEMEDLESGATGQRAEGSNVQRRQLKRGHIWCNLCMVETDHEAYHCEDCDVCIEEYDHHCVFFSKCIGGGNIQFFWGAIGGVLFNFLNIAIMLGVTATIHGALHDDKSPQGAFAKSLNSGLSHKLPQTTGI